MLASSTAWLPLLYDTVIISLTIYRTASSVNAKPASFVRRVLFQEGLLYYWCVKAHVLFIHRAVQLNNPESSCIMQRHLYYHIGLDNYDHLHGRIHPKRCLTVCILLSLFSPRLV